MRGRKQVTVEAMFPVVLVSIFSLNVEDSDHGTIDHSVRMKIIMNIPSSAITQQ